MIASSPAGLSWDQLVKLFLLPKLSLLCFSRLLCRIRQSARLIIAILACCGDALRASHKLEVLLKERERESEEMKYVQDVEISVPKLEC